MEFHFNGLLDINIQSTFSFNLADAVTVLELVNRNIRAAVRLNVFRLMLHISIVRRPLSC